MYYNGIGHHAAANPWGHHILAVAVPWHHHGACAWQCHDIFHGIYIMAVGATKPNDGDPMNGNGIAMKAREGPRRFTKWYERTRMKYVMNPIPSK